MLAIDSTRQDKSGHSGTHLLATALAAGTFAVLFIFMLFAYYQDSAQQTLLRKELDQDLNTVSSAVAWGADNWLAHRVELAEDVAHSIEQSFDGVDAVPQLDSPVYEQTFLWTYFGEMNGGYHIWPHDEMPADYDPRMRPWYHAALLAGESTLTEPYYDISTGVETITVAAPVHRNGELLGVVGADFSTESLSAMLKKTNLGGLGSAFIVTGGGKILAHPQREFVSQNLMEAFPGDYPEVKNEVQFLEKLDTPQIVIFQRIPTLSSVDWYLAISVDKRAAFETLYEFRASAVVATIAAAMLMITVLGVVIHRLLVQPLTNARREADAANVAKSEFLASMSHEIRTPMNGVLGMAEVLTNTNLDERQRELASIIVSSGNALMTVINDILDFAKLEAGKFRLAPRGFNLRHTVYEVATMMQARALEKDIEMIVRYAPDLPEGVVADDSRLRQVLGNLIGNAVKFTDNGYVLVDVTGERIGAEINLTFSVKDTGIGIPEDQIPRMFEKFEQADGSHTRRFGGTGLGLAICKNIVEMMNGEITADSEFGKGSTFRVTLTFPVDDTIQPRQIINQSTFDGVRILAVDDNDVNRRILKELIDGWGLRSTIVSNPVQAMAALEKSIAEDDRYQILLLDYQMPEEDGLTLAGRIQEDPNFDAIPTIILSSIDDALVGERENRAHVEAFLAKPIRPSQLMDTIAEVLADDAPRMLRRASTAMQPAQTEEVHEASGDRIKVLLAEDNVVNQMVVGKFIDASIYELIIAENGEKAVEAFKKSSPSLVLMDLSMPVMDGLEASRCIRQYESDNNLVPTPIIATTAHVLDEDRERCREAGMDDFLPKPMKKTALKDAFDRWLSDADLGSRRETA